MSQGLGDKCYIFIKSNTFWLLIFGHDLKKQTKKKNIPTLEIRPQDQVQGRLHSMHFLSNDHKIVLIFTFLHSSWVGSYNCSTPCVCDSSAHFRAEDGLGGALLAAECQCLPWAAAWLLSPPSLCSWSSSRARCYMAAPPSVPPLPLPGGRCPERRMTNACASSYWRIWTTWLQPCSVPTASTRCWLNGRGLAAEGPICVCIGKIWHCISVYLCTQ